MSKYYTPRFSIEFDILQRVDGFLLGIFVANVDMKEVFKVNLEKNIIEVKLLKKKKYNPILFSKNKNKKYNPILFALKIDLRTVIEMNIFFKTIIMTKSDFTYCYRKNHNKNE